MSSTGHVGATATVLVEAGLGKSEITAATAATTDIAAMTPTAAHADTRRCSGGREGLAGDHGRGGGRVDVAAAAGRLDTARRTGRPRPSHRTCATARCRGS